MFCRTSWWFRFWPDSFGVRPFLLIAQHMFPCYKLCSMNLRARLCILPLMSATCCAAWAQSPSAETSAKAASVTVPFFVVDGHGNPTNGVTRGDVTVLDSKKHQPPARKTSQRHSPTCEHNSITCSMLRSFPQNPRRVGSVVLSSWRMEPTTS